MKDRQVSIIDVFTGDGFMGNPAGVRVSDQPLSATEMQCIAAEVTLSETAFATPTQYGWNLRWFTPSQEVSLCGHATLATAYAISNLKIKNSTSVGPWIFQTASGTLKVWREDDFWWIELPRFETLAHPVPAPLSNYFGSKILSFGTSQNCGVLELCDKFMIKNFEPNYSLIESLPYSGLIITAQSKGEQADFVSRCFYPKEGIPEDPVTGSAHGTLAPFWEKSLKKSTMSALQLSPRGGELKLRCLENRVHVGGRIIQKIPCNNC